MAAKVASTAAKASAGDTSPAINASGTTSMGKPFHLFRNIPARGFGAAAKASGSGPQ
jgi:hypothetical protein